VTLWSICNVERTLWRVGSTEQEQQPTYFCESVDCDEARKKLQLQTESCEVKKVAAELMINGLSLTTQMCKHDSFMMAKDIFAKMEFVKKIYVKYVYVLAYS
jgi:hypothetical protein